VQPGLKRSNNKLGHFVNANIFFVTPNAPGCRKRVSNNTQLCFRRKKKDNPKKLKNKFAKIKIYRLKGIKQSAHNEFVGAGEPQ
jgi:hypothetical protein